MKPIATELFSGTQDQVKVELEKLAETYDIDELVITTMSYDKQLRLKFFNLIAEEMDLKPTHAESTIS